jgi:transmembrane sensor
LDHDSWQLIDDAEGERLARYVAGRSTSIEAAEIQGWIAADPMRAELVDSLRRVWEMAGRPQGEWDVNAAWQELRARQQARRRTRVQPLKRPARVPQRVSPWYLRAAAVLVVAVGGAAFWGSALRQSNHETNAVAMREYQTQRGERAELRLSDGTRVVLSVDTRLRVPETYGVASRDVHLEGEALFEVQHDEKRPFRVHGRSIVAEDLGTVFGVRSYADGSAASVVVKEGLVDVTATTVAARPTQRINPGQRVIVNGDGAMRLETGVDVAALLGFAEGRLVFRDTPLRDAVAQLSRWYDLDIEVSEPALNKRPVSASFDGEPVKKVLDLITLSMGLRYRQDGKVVRLFE